MAKESFHRRIDKDIVKELKAYARKERKTDTEVVEDALREYLRQKGHWPPE
jgi:predicted transcriptional regulator